MATFLLFSFLAVLCGTWNVEAKSISADITTVATGSSTPSTSKTLHLPITNFANIEYYGSIKIGTPGQKIKVAFDITSPNLWVLSSQCKIKSCKRHILYNGSISSTYETDFPSSTSKFDTKHLYSFLNGYFRQDTVSVAGVEAKNFKFAEIDNGDKAAFYLLKNVRYDGVLGLGFPDERGSEESLKPFLFEAVEQDLLASKVFSFYLGRDPKAQVGGELTFGGVNPKYYEGEITYTPVNDKDSFSIGIEGLSVGTSKTCYDKCSGIVNINSPLIAGPREQIATINSAIGIESEDPSTHLVTVDCAKRSAMPDVIITIANRDFVLKPDQYIVELQDISDPSKTRCCSGFLGMRVTKWHLGQVFMRAFYTVFDMEAGKVGLATVATDDTASSQ